MGHSADGRCEGRAPGLLGAHEAGRPDDDAAAAAGVRPRRVLFVCYGNVDRSVMACAFGRRLVKPDVLRFDCAGVGATDGRRVSVATHAHWRTPVALAEYGIGITEHTSRRVTPAMLADADSIYCADDYVLGVVHSLLPPARVGAARLMTAHLPGAERDTNVYDPLGGPLPEFMCGRAPPAARRAHVRVRRQTRVRAGKPPRSWTSACGALWPWRPMLDDEGRGSCVGVFTQYLLHCDYARSLVLVRRRVRSLLDYQRLANIEVLGVLHAIPRLEVVRVHAVLFAHAARTKTATT